MAYTPCTTATVGVNGQPNCSAPAVEGLRTVAVGIALSDIASFVRGATQPTKNHISAIVPKVGAKTFVVEASGEVPFASTTNEFDPATKRFNKTVTFVAPAHGAGFAASFVEPLCLNRDGYVFILQRVDKNGDAAFPIIGLERGAKCTASADDMNDAATAACDTMTFVETNAPSRELDLFDTDYATSLTDFEALVALAV